MTPKQFFVNMMIDGVLDPDHNVILLRPSDSGVDLTGVRHYKERINKIRKLLRLYEPIDLIRVLVAHPTVRIEQAIVDQLKAHEQTLISSTADRTNPSQHKTIASQLDFVFIGL
jgi:hypothetical protein